MGRLFRPPLHMVLPLLLVLVVGLDGAVGQGAGHQQDYRLSRRSREHRRRIQLDINLGAPVYSSQEDFPPEPQPVVDVSGSSLGSQTLASVSADVLTSASGSASATSAVADPLSRPPPLGSARASYSLTASGSTAIPASGTNLPSDATALSSASAAASSSIESATSGTSTRSESASLPSSAGSSGQSTAADASGSSEPSTGSSSTLTETSTTPTETPATSMSESIRTSSASETISAASTSTDGAVASTAQPSSGDSTVSSSSAAATGNEQPTSGNGTDGAATSSTSTDSSISETSTMAPATPASQSGISSESSSATPTPYVTNTANDSPTGTPTSATAPTPATDSGVNSTDTTEPQGLSSATSASDTSVPATTGTESQSTVIGEPSPSETASSNTITPSAVDSTSSSTDSAGPSSSASLSNSSEPSSGVFEPSASPSVSDTPSPSVSDSSSARPTWDPVSNPGNVTTTYDGFPSSTDSDVASVTGAPDRGNASHWSSSSATDSSSTWASDSDAASSTDSSSDYASASASASASGSDAAYTPTASGLIVYTQTSATSSTDQDDTTTPTEAPTATTPSSTKPLPTTASIPSSIPTLIVPANSAVNQPDANTGNADDPLKDDTLISILLNADQYPWLFVVNSSDATSQLFNTFPSLIADSLNITTDQIQTYGLMLYQPASWDGNQADLLTQWLAYIPSAYFSTLNAYVKTQGSPLYSQPGIQGQLAAQINTAYPLAASNSPSAVTTGASERDTKSTRTRDIVIGVCVSIGGLLWLALVYWIYKRVRHSNEKAVHKRMSEHMSMISGAPGATGYGGVETIDRRVSLVPSVAGSDIDDRPSSFYASPFENDATLRRQQRAAEVEASSPFTDVYEFSSSGGQSSPAFGPTISTPQTYGRSVYGQSWYANADSAYRTPQHPYHPTAAARLSGNPFEDIVTRSYLGPHSSNGSLTVPSSAGAAGQRRSAVPRRDVQKGMIGQPQLQGSSLEYHGL